MFVMMRTLLSLSLCLVIAQHSGAIVQVPYEYSQAPEDRPPLTFLSAGPVGQDLLLAGRGAAAQLVAMQPSPNSGDGARDISGKVTWHSDPPGIVDIDDTGWLRPLKDGHAKITATTADGDTVGQSVLVTNQQDDIPVSFLNEVVPVFTKHGCNGGGCHGKSGGQNGFRLSLLGFEPLDDYEYLVHEGRGRRLFPAAPAHSLLLRKATGEIPHGGGQRFDEQSPEYQLLHRWIEQGMPLGRGEVHVERIDVLPRARTLQAGERQQLVIRAVLSDGSTRDVTRLAQYETGDGELAEADVRGLVTAGHATGSTAITIRYQTHVAVFHAKVPLGAPVDDLPPELNFIDTHVFAKLRDLGIPPSSVADDETFLRRATLDIAGRLPTIDEASAFLADKTPTNIKRKQLVGRLLDSKDYVDYFANKWSAILRNRRDRNDAPYATYTFHDWIRESLRNNLPYDEFVSAILTARGDVAQNPPVTWYDEVRDQASQVEDTAQLFLGMRIQCARCHHHPAEKWSQEDYFGLAAFYSRVGRKRSLERALPDKIFHRAGRASAVNPKTGSPVLPTPLGGESLKLGPEEDPRAALAAWMTDPENPFFAKALVNRYWKHFFGRGLVDPEDDMRITNPPTHPALLDELAEQFVASGYDLKELIRTICTSQAYGLSSIPNEHNGDDRQNFARFYPRRLPAEVLLDGIDSLTAMPTDFAGVPGSVRAVSLPDNAFESYFLRVFGRPNAASACECERSGDVNLAQTLHLINSTEVQSKISAARVTKLLAEERSHNERVEELYLVAFARRPTSDELQVSLSHIESQPDDAKAAYEDLVWTIMNTKEFLFNH